MGINGLLPLLKSIQKPTNLKNFKGQTLGVDAYGWLHRGTITCAVELATDKPTKKFVDYAMHRVKMLQHFGVTPYLVFDGDYLPSKAGTEHDRAKRRFESKKLGMELLNAGKPSQAFSEFQKSIDVTPEMARLLIDELKKEGVKYVVAPYEADPQMVYLERHGIIDGILSEDSDLLVFGAKCLLTKLDQYGNCIEVNKANFSACKEINLTGWSDREFRHMAILSGCDYLSSITNMGLKTAYRMVRKHKTVEKVVRMLQFDGKFHVPLGYLDAFYQAELTFLHQRVFCPRNKLLVYHTEPASPLDEAKVTFIGAALDPDVAQRVASGELNPMTKLPIHTSLTVLPRAPWQSRQPSIRASTQENLNKGQTIDHFFGPARIPMAELCTNTPPKTSFGDNCDSDGNRLLVIASEPRPGPRPQLLRSTTTPLTRASRASHPTSRPFGRILLQNGAAASEPPPSKRARLCAAEDVAAEIVDENHLTSPSMIEKLMSGRSPFFSEPCLSQPSPSFDRNHRRVNKDDFVVLSDASPADVSHVVPEVATKKAKLFSPDFEGKSTVVFKDSPQGLRKMAFNEIMTSKISEGTSQITPDSTSTVDLPSSTQGIPDTATCSRSSMLEDLKIEVPSSAAAIRSRYVYTPTTTTIGVRKFAFLPTPPSSGLSKPHHVQISTFAAPTLHLDDPSSSASGGKQNLTPLQTLGAKALSRPSIKLRPSSDTQPHTPSGPTATSRFGRAPEFKINRTGAASASANLTRKVELSKLGMPFPEMETISGGSPAPKDIPLPAVTEQEVLALTTYGSEDAIIRDSEEETSDDENESGPTPAARLRLSRFAFTA